MGLGMSAAILLPEVSPSRVTSTPTGPQTGILSEAKADKV